MIPQRVPVVPFGDKTQPPPAFILRSHLGVHFFISLWTGVSETINFSKVLDLTAYMDITWRSLCCVNVGVKGLGFQEWIQFPLFLPLPKCHFWNQNFWILTSLPATQSQPFSSSLIILPLLIVFIKAA